MPRVCIGCGRSDVDFGLHLARLAIIGSCFVDDARVVRSSVPDELMSARDEPGKSPSVAELDHRFKRQPWRP